MLFEPSSRRGFLRSSGAMVIGGGIVLHLSGCRDASDSAAEAIRADAGPRVLADAERGALEAFADRIIPPDGDALGAAGLGAVVFMTA